MTAQRAARRQKQQDPGDPGRMRCGSAQTRLPRRHYVAGHWSVAWTGFDVVLLGCLAVTAWGLWKGRQIVVPASMITSVLLLCDAWFDLLTANGYRDLIASAASALFAELPLATLLCLLSVRALRVAARTARGLEPNAPIAPLWRTPLLTFPAPGQGAPLESRDPSSW